MAKRRGSKKRPRRRSPGHRPQKARLLTLEDLERFPPPPESPETRGLAMALLALSPPPPETRALDLALLRKGRFLHEVFDRADEAALASTKKAKPRGKLTNEVWRTHLEKYPLNKPVSANFRKKRLEIDHGVVVDRTTVTKRLGKQRSQ